MSTFEFAAVSSSEGGGGATVLSGAGLPADTTGADGEFYLDTNTRTVYGPKANGTWGTNLESHREGRNTSAGGQYTHAEGYGATANADRSHAEGNGTTTNGHGSHAEGASTTTSGVASHAEGSYTVAGGWGAHAEGDSSEAYGDYSHAEGRQSRATRHSQRAKASGQFAALGDAQLNELSLHAQTTDATPTVLTAAGGAPALTGRSSNVLTLPVGRAHRFRIEAIARRTDGTADVFAAWKIEGVIARPASGNARFVGVPAVTADSDAGVTWDLTVSVDTTNATNNYLAITVTGEAGATIRWVARLETTEVG